MASIIRLKVDNEKPTYRLTTEQPKPTRRLTLDNEKPTYRLKIKNVMAISHMLSPKLDLYPSDTLYPSTVKNITIRISGGS